MNKYYVAALAFVFNSSVSMAEDASIDPDKLVISPSGVLIPYEDCWLVSGESTLDKDLQELDLGVFLLSLPLRAIFDEDGPQYAEGCFVPEGYEFPNPPIELDGYPEVDQPGPKFIV